MFLILTADRFTQYDLELAEKVNSMGKTFFLIRTKIDQDRDNENRKDSPNVEEMVKRIRDKCYNHVKKLGIDEDKIFLINNHHTEEWDFERLIIAILGKLSDRQKEAFTLSLSLRSLSEEIVKKRVEVLRGMLRMLSAYFQHVASDRGGGGGGRCLSSIKGACNTSQL